MGFGQALSSFLMINKFLPFPYSKCAFHQTKIDVKLFGMGSKFLNNFIRKINRFYCVQRMPRMKNQLTNEVICIALGWKFFSLLFEPMENPSEKIFSFVKCVWFVQSHHERTKIHFCKLKLVFVSLTSFHCYSLRAM